MNMLAAYIEKHEDVDRYKMWPMVIYRFSYRLFDDDQAYTYTAEFICYQYDGERALFRVLYKEGIHRGHVTLCVCFIYDLRVHVETDHREATGYIPAGHL